MRASALRSESLEQAALTSLLFFDRFTAARPRSPKMENSVQVTMKTL